MSTVLIIQALSLVAVAIGYSIASIGRSRASTFMWLPVIADEDEEPTP